MSYFQKYFSSYIQRILVVVSGSAGAQIISISTYPLISRLFTASEFGVLTVFLALTNVGALIGTLRLDQAVVLPEKEEEANSLVTMVLVFSALFSIVAFMVYGGIDFLIGFTEKGHVSGIFYLMPIAIVLSSASLALRALTIRSNLFRILSFSATAKAGLLVGTILFLNSFKELSGLSVLVLSNIGALVVEVTILLTSLMRKSKFELLLDMQLGKDMLKKFRKFPVFQLPADFVNMAGAQSPTYLLGALYDPALVGYFGMTQRIFGLPIKLVSASTLEVYKRDASIEFREKGNCTGIYKRTFKMLLLLAIVPSLLMLFLGPKMFSFVLGEEWTTSGEYAQFLTPMLFLQFAASPLAFTLLIADKHHINFRWQLGLLIATVSGLLIGWLYSNSDMSIIGYSVMYCLMYGLSLYLSFNASKGTKTITF